MAVRFDKTKKTLGLNCEPMYKFTPTTSLVIEYETQYESDYFLKR